MSDRHNWGTMDLVNNILSDFKKHEFKSFKEDDLTVCRLKDDKFCEVLKSKNGNILFSAQLVDGRKKLFQSKANARELNVSLFEEQEDKGYNANKYNEIEAKILSNGEFDYVKPVSNFTQLDYLRSWTYKERVPSNMYISKVEPIKKNIAEYEKLKNSADEKKSLI